MTDSIRAALERLIARLDETTDPNGPVPAWSDSFLAARTLLAQPEPAGEVSDEELHVTFYRHSFDDFRQRLMTWQEFHAGARAAIALALSRHASQVADGDRQPSGYAYRYQQFGDSVIRFNGGGEVNGSRPTEAIPYWLGRPSDALAARPLLEQVARMGDCIGANTVGQIMAISDRAASWLRENPPGQPVAIEPRGCPTPGACSCVEPQPVAVGERLPELRQRFETTLNGARCLSDRPVGNVELADRLLDDVLAWHTPTTPPEAA